MWKSGVGLALGVLYPLIVLFALHFLEPRAVALVALGLAGVRFGSTSSSRTAAFTRTVAPMAIGVATVFVATAVWNDPLGLLLVPSLVSVTLLAGFAHSLRAGPPMIERFARLQVETLSQAEVAYCYRVTVVWCAFFVANGAIALGLALTDDLERWALYTGLVSYLAIGTLFAMEYVYRHWKFRRYVGSLTDPVLSFFFPPHEQSEPSAAPATAERDANRSDANRTEAP